MKNFASVLPIVFLISLSMNAQHLEEILSKHNNLKDIQISAEAYFKHKTYPSVDGQYMDNEFLRYKRQEWYWSNRVDKDGKLPDILSKHEIYKSLQPQGKQMKRSGTWKNISQQTTLSGYDGMGRVATVAFHPTDTNIIFVGTNQGGIWKSVTGGNSWTPLGDQLPFASTGNIVIDPLNPSIMYITVGNREGWWHYGLGVYKSTDGGTTWNPTANACNFVDQRVYYKLTMSPVDNQVLYSAQSNGFFKSTDAGATWTLIYNGSFNDFEFKPFHANTIYLAKTGSGSNNIYKSIDGGASFTVTSNFGFSNADIELSVTPADSNYIGVGIESQGTKYFYLSSNGGTSFTQKTNSLADNAIIQMSALNKNRAYCGFTENYQTTNGGGNWVQITNWYNDGVLPTVHADNRSTEINPLLPHYIYFCNDGGLYRYNENNNTWTDLSQGLIVTEFYKLDCSQQDSIFIMGGTQDNGGRKRVGLNIWGATNGGDGMEVAVHPTNDQTIYTTYWGGTLYRSYDQWDQDVYNDISPDPIKAAWVTPYMLDPNNPNRLIGGYSNNVWASNNEGNTWNIIGNDLTGDIDKKLEVLDIAPSNSNYIYTGWENTLYYTANGGSSWSLRNVPTVNGVFEKVTCVKYHPKNENLLFVTKGGYGNNSKVYRSINGNNFQNITYNLPNIPVNCLLINAQSDSSNVDIYIGTDVGVFYKKDSSNTWQYYGTGLPNTEVSDLVIFYPGNKLRAATYGRGIWETDLNTVSFPSAIHPISKQELEINLLENPASNYLRLTVVSPENESLTFKVLDASGRNVLTQVMQINSGSQQLEIALPSLSAGIYFLDIHSKNKTARTIQWIKN